MSKALDLSLFVKQTLDITMPDGEVIHIKKPTQNGVLKLMAFQDVDEEHALDVMDELTLYILNCNNGGKEYTKEWMDDNLDWTMKVAVIRAYSDFINELQADPNL